MKKTLLSLLILIGFNTLDAQIVEINNLTNEQKIANKEAVLFLVQMKESEKDLIKLNEINLEIFKRGYGHFLSENEFSLIREEVKKMKTILKEDEE